MRVMAIDYGVSRVGVAITDPLCTISQPLLTIKFSSEKKLLKRLKCLVEENGVGLILVGYPISLKGNITRMSTIIRKFADKLKKTVDVEVRLWDERYTSQYAARLLKGLKVREQKQNLDQVAASIMLREYLESLS